jgi:hypothetical protein
VTFNEVLSQTIAMLHQHGRVSYRALKRQFAIPDDYLEDLTDAILFAYPQVRDEEGRGLVWTGDTPMAPRGMEGAARAPAPLAYTPPYLAEKILTSRSALAISYAPDGARRRRGTGVPLCYPHAGQRVAVSVCAVVPRARLEVWIGEVAASSLVTTRPCYPRAASIPLGRLPLPATPPPAATVC